MRGVDERAQMRCGLDAIDSFHARIMHCCIPYHDMIDILMQYGDTVMIVSLISQAR